jgi:hypothetical protein
MGWSDCICVERHAKNVSFSVEISAARYFGRTKKRERRLLDALKHGTLGNRQRTPQMLETLVLAVGSSDNVDRSFHTSPRGLDVSL